MTTTTSRAIITFEMNGGGKANITVPRANQNLGTMDAIDGVAQILTSGALRIKGRSARGLSAVQLVTTHRTRIV